MKKMNGRQDIRLACPKPPCKFYWQFTLTGNNCSIPSSSWVLDQVPVRRLGEERRILQPLLVPSGQLD